MGFAFDGDADRCLAVDERGQVLNGDKIMYICAKHFKERGQLPSNTLVTTVMSNSVCTRRWTRRASAMKRPPWVTAMFTRT